MAQSVPEPALTAHRAIRIAIALAFAAATCGPVPSVAQPVDLPIPKATATSFPSGVTFSLSSKASTLLFTAK